MGFSDLDRPARAFFVIGAGLHLIFALSLVTGLLNPLFVEACEGHGQASDFYGIYQAGANLLGGYSIYDHENYRQEAPQVVPFYYYYRYLPPTAYGAALGALLFPPQIGYWVWVLLVEAILLVAVGSLLRWGQWPARRRWILAGLWLGFFPFYIEQIMGQYSLCMAALLWFIWRYDADPNPADSQLVESAAQVPAAPRGHLLWGSGWPQAWKLYRWRDDRLGKASSWAAWASSLALKSFTVLLAFAYLRDGKVKRVIAGGALAAAVSLPYFLHRPADLMEFVRLNFAPFTPRIYKGAMGLQTLLQDVAAQFPTLSGQTLLTLGDRTLTVGRMSMLGCAGLIGILGVWATLQAGGARQRRALDIAIWTSVFFLIFKSVWEYHYVMMLPAISAAYLVTGSRLILGIGVLIGLPSLYALAPILAGVPANASLEEWPGWFRSLHFSMKSLPTLLFFFWCLVAARQGRFRAARPTGY